MRYRSSLPRELPPLDLLVPTSVDAYQETGPELARLELAERQTKLRSRQIAASALRYCRDAGDAAPGILETDVVRIVEILAGGMVAEFDSPTPFSQDCAADIIDLINSKGAKWDAWEMLAKGMVSSAECELSLEDFLAFEAKVGDMVFLLRCWRAASAIDDLRASAVRPMAERILAFCKAEGEVTPEDSAAALAGTLDKFLVEFSASLKTGSRQLIRHRLAAAAAEILAANWEAANREWQFLFATLEQTLHEKLGPARSFELKGWFLLLNSFIPRLTFAGYLVAESQRIADRAPEFGELSGIPVLPFLRVGAAEVLLGADPDADPALLEWAIVHKRCLFSGANVNGQAAARRELLDAILRDVERSWTDWLDEFLHRLSRVLNWCDRESAIKDSCRKLAESAYGNLREALDAVQNNPRFPSQLLGLLERATVAVAYFGTGRLASAYLRKWFVANIALGERENGWGHVRTITTALKTAIRQNPDATTALPQGVTDLIDQIELWLQETSAALDIWPSITVHGLQLERFLPDASCQRDSLWLLRRGLIALVSCGYRGAPGAVQKWMAAEVVPFARSSSVEAFRMTASRVRSALEEALPEMGAAMRAMFEEVFEAVPLAVLHRRLWDSSDRIGEAVAAALYASCEDYREKAGEGSQALCARDTAIILRRVAASLSPDIDDRQDFVGTWWNNLVNLYLVTRTGGIFARQLQAITEQLTATLGDQASTIVSGILRPVFETAPEGFRQTLPPRLLFRPLLTNPPSGAMMSAPALLSAKQELVAEFKTWLENEMPAASKYADSFFPASGERPVGTLLLDLLTTGLGTQLSGCGLYGALDRAVLANSVPCARSSRHAARLCAGLLYASESLPAPRAGLYQACLAEWAAFFRQRAAGFALREVSAKLAASTAAHIHHVAPELIKRGATSPSEEKCGRDFAFLLGALAEAMESAPPSESTFAAHRYIIQMVLPYTRYARDAWRMMWQAAALLIEIPEDAPSADLLRSLFFALETSGRNFETIRPLAKKINAGDHTVFSPNPSEEVAWRDLSNALLALSCLEGETFHAASALVAFSLPPALGPAIGARLPKLVAAWRKWFPASNLESVASAVDTVTQLIEAAARLHDFAKDLPEIVSGYASVVGGSSPGHVHAFFLAHVYLRASGLAAPTVGTWGDPTLPLTSLLLEKSAGAFDTASPAFANVLANLLGPVLPKNHRLTPVIDELRASLVPLPALDAILAGMPGENLSPACRRDQSWLCRRTLHATRYGGGAEAVFRWLRVEVAPFAGERSPEVWLSLLGECFRACCASSAEGSPLHVTASECASRLPGWVLARHLSGNASSIARTLVDRFRHEIGSSDPDKCARDVSLALGALAACAENVAPYENWNAWWEESVRPFLRDETSDLKNMIYGHLPEVLRESAPEPLSARAAALLA